MQVITVPLVALMLSNAKWDTTVAALAQPNALHAMLEVSQKAKACPSVPYVIQVIIKTQLVKVIVQYVQGEIIVRLLEL